MIFWIMVAIALIVVAIVTVAEARVAWGEPFGAFVMTALLTGGGVAVMSAVFLSVTPKDDGKVISIELQALTTSKDTSGSFFLGSGYIDKELTYVFYAKVDGGYRMDSLPADDVLIVESDSSPRLETACQDTKWWVAPFKCVSKSRTLYVPPGSVKPMVNLDLPKS